MKKYAFSHKNKKTVISIFQSKIIFFSTIFLVGPCQQKLHVDACQLMSNWLTRCDKLKEKDEFTFTRDFWDTLYLPFDN